MVFKQHAVDKGHTKKDRGTIFFENPADDIRRGFLATKNRSQPVEQRKSKTVSEPVSEGQARRREESIAFTKFQDFITEGCVGVKDVRLPVYRAFWLRRAACGVKNERVLVV